MSLAFEMKGFAYEGVLFHRECAKMLILRMEVPLFEWASCMDHRTICQYFCCLGYMTRIGYSMFSVGYGIYTREQSSRVYIS